MAKTPHEQALLAERWISGGRNPLWWDFPRYWMAFNALYNAVRNKGDSEKDAIRNVIQIFMKEDDAYECLSKVRHHIDELTALPPGDDRLHPSNPKYRQKSTFIINEMERNTNPVSRLANLMLLVYQVRCNLFHGSKDPTIMRDQALVTSCTPILEVVVPCLSEIMYSHHEQIVVDDGDEY